MRYVPLYYNSSGGLCVHSGVIEAAPPCELYACQVSWAGEGGGPSLRLSLFCLCEQALSILKYAWKGHKARQGLSNWCLFRSWAYKARRGPISWYAHPPCCSCIILSLCTFSCYPFSYLTVIFSRKDFVLVILSYLLLFSYILQ